MAMEGFKSAPLPTIRRIPVYLRVLEEMQEEGQEWASATDVATRLDLKPIQVRKDMAFTGLAGVPKRGFKVDELISAIRDFLGWDKPTDAFLVGAGALGSALMGFAGFKDHGLNIVAAFDTASEKLGTTIHGKEILDLTRFKELAQRMHIEMGIITAPAVSAQRIADLMVEAGIKGIWNFSPVPIKVPDDVAVQREDLSVGLAVLSVKLSSLSPEK